MGNLLIRFDRASDVNSRSDLGEKIYYAGTGFLHLAFGRWVRVKHIEEKKTDRSKSNAENVHFQDRFYSRILRISAVVLIVIFPKAALIVVSVGSLIGCVGLVCSDSYWNMFDAYRYVKRHSVVEPKTVRIRSPQKTGTNCHSLNENPVKEYQLPGAISFDSPHEWQMAAQILRSLMEENMEKNLDDFPSIIDAFASKLKKDISVGKCMGLFELFYCYPNSQITEKLIIENISQESCVRYQMIHLLTAFLRKRSQGFPFERHFCLIKQLETLFPTYGKRILIPLIGKSSFKSYDRNLYGFFNDYFKMIIKRGCDNSLDCYAITITDENGRNVFLLYVDETLQKYFCFDSFFPKGDLISYPDFDSFLVCIAKNSRDHIKQGFSQELNLKTYDLRK